jgi:hypothetical protein
MASIKLTQTRVQRLSFDPDLPPKQVLFDTLVPGFGVRVYASGKKSYMLMYGPAQARKTP